MRIRSVVAPMTVIVVATAACPTTAELIDRFTVGAGSQAASIQFDFLDGRTWVFDVQWDGGLTGRAAFDLIASDDSGRFDFDFDVITYSFGDFLTGVTIDDASDFGTGTPPDYADTWHYWLADDATAPWSESFIGFNDRTLFDGARDGWVFGTSAPPAVVPAPGGVALAVMTLATRRRRRNRPRSA